MRKDNRESREQKQEPEQAEKQKTEQTEKEESEQAEIQKSVHTEKEDGRKGKSISWRRLTWEAIPELWSFQTFSAVVLALLTTPLIALINRIAETNGTAVTTANLQSLYLSWRLPAILVTGFVLVSVFVILEILAQIHNCYDILTGNRAGVRRELSKSFPDIRHFLNPAGFALILYVFIAVPLTGVGFGISLSENFYIPRFITNVIYNKPLYMTGYAALIVFLSILGIRWLFAFHAVVIDRVTPSEGKKISIRIIKEHWKVLLLHFLQFALAVILIYTVLFIVFSGIPEILLERKGADLPSGVSLTAEEILSSGLSPEEKSLVVYRILAVLFVLFNSYIRALIIILSSAYLMLMLTKDYLFFTRGELTEYRSRMGRFAYLVRAGSFIGGFILIGLLSIGAGLSYSELFADKVPVEIIAHRAGGNLAAENSMEGIYQAIDHGCYGSETDVQRTKDGFYIINHDDNFKRLCGAAKTPQSMTLEEIRSLRIRNPEGADVPVPTLEEMLDAIKGKEVLYIELKGKTADLQMADDVVAMVREKDCVDDVVIISLKYNLIEYIEETYPEFETGVLVFAGLGNIERLHCDLLIMEEEMSTQSRINSIHAAGKKAITWTVNTKDSLLHFLDSDLDAVITDQIELAQQIQEELHTLRTDLDIIEAKLRSLINPVY